jgi:hypothetical protein
MLIVGTSPGIEKSSTGALSVVGFEQPIIGQWSLLFWKEISGIKWR